MITRSQSQPMTYRDLRRLPDDLLRHELINGEHFVSPAPELKHQRIVLNLARILSNFVRAHRLGEVLIAPVDVLFSEHDVVEPDVLYVSGEKADRLRRRFVAGAPDLVIEVLSPSNRVVDRTKKYRLYEAQGVPEYWIVDPATDTLEVYRAAAPGGALAPTAALSPAAGDVLETPLLPGLRIPLSEVFE
ncbi:MAG TPA: Uma2 family endonuclease [Thermoanaerobaculia bacterium]|nr:Uma2 family endonuclease [Thermoanaerobaculia bacterium]